MTVKKTQQVVADIMDAFAIRTGVTDATAPPRRYLWTDSFAVVNFLELHRQTNDPVFLESALRLVGQVHDLLGQHRLDDPRTGWISGLNEEEGRAHPTRGGLRIGKVLSERGPAEPFDEHLEWGRDGQYFHYLTKWMHSLSCVSQATGDGHHLLWATELAKTAHRSFVYRAPQGTSQMFWKMSIDLARPLVTTMGHHDPLDGLVTFLELRAAAERASYTEFVELTEEIEAMRAMCHGTDWATADPLGIGSLLFDAFRLLQLVVEGYEEESRLLETIVNAAFRSLHSFVASGLLDALPSERLAFRELGLSIGLRALPLYSDLWQGRTVGIRSRADFERLRVFHPIADRIEGAWITEDSQATHGWHAHEDINSVMLATSLLPGEYLSIT